MSHCSWCGEYVSGQDYNRDFDACEPCVIILTDTPHYLPPDESNPMDGMEDPRLEYERFLAEIAQEGGQTP